MKSIKKRLGARIKEIRRDKGLTQEELSEKIGIDPKHLSRIEVGRGFPSLDTLSIMADVLGVEMKDFFEFAHRTEKPKELKETLNSLMKEATEEKLRVAVKVLRAIVR